MKIKLKDEEGGQITLKNEQNRSKFDILKFIDEKVHEQMRRSQSEQTATVDEKAKLKSEILNVFRQETTEKKKPKRIGEIPQQEYVNYFLESHTVRKQEKYEPELDDEEEYARRIREQAERHRELQGQKTAEQLMYSQQVLATYDEYLRKRFLQ